jgi:hypothetical protein
MHTTIATKIPLDGLEQAAFFHAETEDGKLSIRLFLRRLGEDESLASFDHDQNYARYTASDHRVLDCTIQGPAPIKRLNKQRKNNPDYKPSDDMAAGILRMGVPTACLTLPCVVILRLTSFHYEMFVDGVPVDEEYPATEVSSTGLRITTGEAQLWNHALSNSEIVELCGGQNAVKQKEEAILGPDIPLGQYWTPRGHNALFGDTMLTAEGDKRLHLYWLFDRRFGRSKFGAGGHPFAHASTTDLFHWEHHPRAREMSHLDEGACGTGCVVFHEGRHYLYSNTLSERMTANAADYPNGVHLSISEDGLHFQDTGPAGFTGEPGIVRDEAGLFHAVSSSQHPDGIWRTSLLISPDLINWKMAEPSFLPDPGWPCTREVFSCECFNWFKFGDWWFIIGGRTGFWRSRQLLGPYSRVNSPAGPKWDIYDGLFVPQVAVFRGRAILSGWLAYNETDYAGHLVWRELVLRDDGDLDMRRLPEMEDAPASGVQPLEIVSTSGFTHARLAHPPLLGRLRLRIDSTQSQGSYGLLLGGAPGEVASSAQPGVQLRFGPETRTVAFITPGKTTLSTEMPFNGGDLAILEVNSIDQPFNLDIRIHHEMKHGTWIIDAEINGCRTMITRRSHFLADTIYAFTEGGTLRIS